MGCNCKTGGTPNPNFKSNNNDSGVNPRHKNLSAFLSYTAKLIGFFVGLLLLPLINIAIVWFMFNTLVLTKEVDVRGLFARLTKTKKFKSLIKDDEYDDYDDEDDDYENLTEDDLIMVDVEDITPKSK
jgi:hypothetical protein